MNGRNGLNGTLVSIMRSVAAALVAGSIVSLIFVWSDQRSMANDVHENTAQRKANAAALRQHEKDEDKRLDKIEQSLTRQETILEGIAQKVGAPVPPEKPNGR